jgi:DNA-binding response OmpR family regulator
MTHTRIPVGVVEDDADLAEEVGFHLSRAGFKPTLLENGVALDRYLKDTPSAVLVLDVGLPGEDGFSIARRLYQERQLRIVMLTARESIEDRLQGIGDGADVYLTKPVDFRELVAVVTRLSTRLRNPGCWRLDESCAQLQCPNGKQVSLTRQEVLLMGLLADVGEAGLRREEAEYVLWNISDEFTARRLEVAISRLRIKLQKTCDNAPIRAHCHNGYLFAAHISRI